MSAQSVHPNMPFEPKSDLDENRESKSVWGLGQVARDREAPAVPTIFDRFCLPREPIE